MHHRSLRIFAWPALLLLLPAIPAYAQERTLALPSALSAPDPAALPAFTAVPVGATEQKLATVLRDAIAAHAADPAGWQQRMNPGALRLSEDGVLVEITFDSERVAVSPLVAEGVKIRHHHARTLESWVPVELLRTVASRSDVLGIRPALLLQPAVGATTTEGLAAAQADVWHAAGFDGTGVTIANIDLGYAGFAARQATGDWPTGAQLTTVDINGGGFGTGTDPHGTGTLEINFDVAPGANFVAYEVTTRGDWVAAMNHAVGTAGADVVSVSLGQPLDGVGDGSACPPTNPTGCGSVAEAVAAARAAGVLVVNAAGNKRRQHWGGLYQPHAGNATFHDFGGGIIVNSSAPFCYAVGTTIRLELFWDDWTNVNHDYALELYQVNTAGTAYQLVALSNATQNGGAGQTPQEAIAFTITSSSGNCPAGFGFVAAAVRRVIAPTNRNLQLFSNYDLEFSVPARSLAFPADSPDLIAVAAANVNTLSQEIFSSEGPVLGPGGTLGPSSILKPDLISTDGVSTQTFGASGFLGTSASTPHVAGIAALLLEKHPEYDVAQLANALLSRASQRDLGPLGFDSQYGEGLLNLGLVAMWPFSEGTGGTGTVTADVAGDGKNGALMTSPPPAWVPGKVGTGLQFLRPYSNQVGVSSSSPELDLTKQISISAWVKRNAASDNYNFRIIAMKTASQTGWAAGYGFYSTRISGVEQLCAFIGNHGNPVNRLCSDGATDILAVDTIHHVVFTYDHANMRIYVDGVERASKAKSDDISTTFGWFRIGNYPGQLGSPYAFSGMIDEVRVYSRGLSAAEVQHLYNNP